MFWDSYSNSYDVITQLAPYLKLMQTIEYYASINSADLVLDLGCGTGNIERNRANVIGLDLSANMIKIASVKNKSSKFVLANCDQGLPFQDSSFDKVIVNNVFNYVSKPSFVIQEISKVLKRGGIFVASILKKNFSPPKIMLSHIRERGALNLLPYLPLLIRFGFENVKIVRRLRSGEYKSFTPEIFEQFLHDNKFTVLHNMEVYANQNWLYVAQKK